MTVTLGSVGTTYGGLTGKSGKDFGHGSGRFVVFTEVMSAPRLPGRSLGHVDVRKNERQNEVRRGDVLFNGSSETPEEVALSAVVDFDVPKGVYLNSFCFGYRIARRDVIDPTYLSYFFRSGVGREVVFGLAQGATRYNISKTKLLGVPLDLPSFHEQKSIAAGLVQVDDLIASLERLITKKRAIKQGMMQELLTGRTRLPGFSAPWISATFADVVRIQRGSIMTRAGAGQGSVPVVAGGKSPAGYTDVPNRVGRTITISASGASAGYVALYDGPIYASDCSTIGSADHYDLDFIYYNLSLRQEEIYRAQTGGAQPHIHARDIYPIELQLPVDVAEQAGIGRVIKDADAEIVALERRLKSTHAIKQGMMQELLTGRTRLPVAEEVSV